MPKVKTNDYEAFPFYIGRTKGLTRQGGRRYNARKCLKFERAEALEVDVIGLRKHRYVYEKYGKILDWKRDKNLTWKFLRDNQYK